MNLRQTLLALALVASPAAFAAPVLGTVTMSFEDIPAVVSYTDAIGGAYSGASFSGDALKLDNNDGVGPYAENLPSGSNMMFVASGSSVLGALDGALFGGVFSFSYTSLSAIAGGVQVYSGLNGTGSLLASFDLAGDGTTGCTSGLPCNWHTQSLALGGHAGSIVFTGSDAVFDDISVTTVPEPTSLALVLAALAGATGMARRRRA